MCISIAPSTIMGPMIDVCPQLSIGQKYYSISASRSSHSGHTITMPQLTLLRVRMAFAVSVGLFINSTFECNFLRPACAQRPPTTNAGRAQPRCYWSFIVSVLFGDIVPIICVSCRLICIHCDCIASINWEICWHFYHLSLSLCLSHLSLSLKRPIA